MFAVASSRQCCCPEEDECVTQSGTSGIAGTLTSQSLHLHAPALEHSRRLKPSGRLAYERSVGALHPHF